MDILHSFFLRPGFVPLGFTGKVFNETIVSNPKEYCTLFLIFSHGVFLSKVLMSHILMIIQRGVL